ncbi:MAG: lipopolysaccharide biosynthesis protein [Hyphomicrobium sp.]|nr:lipopolysaccharide biosynthesis protein [Hyphomicrobium sp.]
MSISAEGADRARQAPFSAADWLAPDLRGRQNVIATASRFVSDLKAAADDRSRAQRDALIAFSVRVASAALLYLSQVALARWMGSFEYGIYVFVWTWVLVLGGLSHAGFNLVMMRQLPAYREASDFEHYRGLLLGGRMFTIAASCGIALAGLVALQVFSETLAHHSVLPLTLALFCVPLFALTEVQDGIGRGERWIISGLLAPYVLRPLLLLAAMGSALAAGWPMNATTAASAAILATLGAALVQLSAIEWRITETVPAGPRRYAFGKWIAASLPLVAVSGAELVLQNADVLAISRFLSPTDVAIYFASAKTMSLIMFVHYAVASAVANRFSTLNVRGDRAALEAFVKDAVNWTFWPSLAGAAFILALGQPLLSLFGPEFQSGYPVMAVLVVGFMLRSSFGPVETLMNMLGESRLCAAVLIGAAVFDLLLCFALVPAYGLMGAAVATAASLAIAALGNAVAAKKRLGIDVAIWRNL